MKAFGVLVVATSATVTVAASGLLVGLVLVGTADGPLVTVGVLGLIPAFDPLQPYLLTFGWYAGTDVLRDPLPLDQLVATARVAALHLAGGGAVLVLRMLRRPSDPAPRPSTNTPQEEGPT